MCLNNECRRIFLRDWIFVKLLLLWAVGRDDNRSRCQFFYSNCSIRDCGFQCICQKTLYTLRNWSSSMGNVLCTWWGRVAVNNSTPSSLPLVKNNQWMYTRKTLSVKLVIAYILFSTGISFFEWSDSEMQSLKKMPNMKTSASTVLCHRQGFVDLLSRIMTSQGAIKKRTLYSFGPLWQSG